MLNGCGSKAERLIATTSQERCAHAEWRVLHMASSENLQALAFTPVVVAKLGNIPLLATDQVSIRAEVFSRLGFESDFVCGIHRFRIASASRLAHSNSVAHEHPLLADCGSLPRPQFDFGRELARQPLATCLLAVVPGAFVECAICTEVVLRKRAVLEAALDEETSGERRSSKDTVSELDFNKLGGVEQTPVPRGFIDLATTQDTLKCLTLEVEIREGAVPVDVVRPAPRHLGLVREIYALV